jgi:hypothetical protein
VPADFEKTYDLYMEQATESALLNLHRQHKKKKTSPSSAINSHAPIGEPIYYRSWLEHKKYLDAMKEKGTKLSLEKKKPSTLRASLTSIIDFFKF